MKRRTTRVALALTLVLVAHPPASAADGQMTLGVPVALPAAWLDPAEATGILIPFMVYYALHDALVKPMPGNAMAPSLAASWSVSPDGRTYEFLLRQGARFHNGEPVTADDVKFSLERYRGVSAKIFKDRIQDVQVVDPQRVRIRLKDAWPDFLTFYATPATGAAWVVPRKYVEKVGDDGFKRAPVGAGPYRFVSFTPGVELVLEASEQYWRKKPSVKRLVFKAMPDQVTRLAALKSGEVDIAYGIGGELGEDVRRTPGLTLRPTPFSSTHWLLFADQWEARSPWHDKRVRLAAIYAVDRQAINEAQSLGFSQITGSIIPRSFDFYWQPPVHPFDPAKAKQLLTEAGYPNGFEAGDLWCDAATSPTAEAILTYLQAVGIKTKLRPLERAGFMKEYQEKKLRNLIYGLSGIFGNAATRLEVFTASSGMYAYGAYPDIDDLFREQVAELDPQKREAILHRIQQLIYDKAMYLPLMQLAALSAYGPRVAEPGLGLITDYPWVAPYEEVKLKAQ